jgi:hypothetical protein
MKKLGILALFVAALGTALVGCEPAKKKTETKSMEMKTEEPKMDGAAPTKTETTTETKTDEGPK